MIKSCKECMEGAPYNYCCKIECGQHEFCRGCKYTPQHKCYHEASSPITGDDDKLLDVLKSGGDLKDTVIDWSKARSLEPVIDWSKARPLPPVTDKTEDNNLIPIEKVIDDMYSDSCISSSARDYYFIHYATEDEKEEIRKQEKMEFLFSACFLSMPFICLIVVCLAIIFS